MAVNYYFFDAKKTGDTYDRVYSSGDFARYLEGLVGSGVFPIPSTSLQVYAGSGMQVKVKPGMGWIDGHKITNDADLTLSIEQADVTLNRIDRIVFKLDLLNRNMSIYVKKGTNSSKPSAPSLERTEYLKEYSLATITINKQTTTITDSMIRDTRLDSSVCGMVQGLIDQVDTETLFKQWEAAYDEQYDEQWNEFKEWFNNVKDSLSTSVMWHEYKNVIRTSSSNVKTINIGIPQYNDAVDILTVYVNGMRLDSSEYTSDSTQITLTQALNIIDTVIEIVVYKSINGEGADTVLEQVADHESRITKLEELSYIYKCTGADDNKTLSELAQNFLLAKGPYVGIAENTEMIVKVVGRVGFNSVYTGSGSADDPLIWFVLGKFNNLHTSEDSTNSTRKITFDFTNAERISLPSQAGYKTVMIGGSDINIIGLQAVLGGDGSTLNWFNGQNARVTDSMLYMNAKTTAIGSTSGGTFERCRLSATSINGKANVLVSDGTTPLKAVDCYIICYNGTSATDESICVLAEASKTESVVIVERCNMPIIARGGYKQSQTIKINSGYASIISNILGKAAALYSTEKCTNVGSMIISK